jgi:hypothetical protein
MTLIIESMHMLFLIMNNRQKLFFSMTWKSLVETIYLCEKGITYVLFNTMNVAKLAIKKNHLSLYIEILNYLRHDRIHQGPHNVAFLHWNDTVEQLGYIHMGCKELGSSRY